jgi:hypothetical protein
VNELCACFAVDVPNGTVIEQLDGEFLTCCTSDMETYHPYQYPDANLSLTLVVTTAGGKSSHICPGRKELQPLECLLQIPSDGNEIKPAAISRLDGSLTLITEPTKELTITRIYRF